MKKFGLLIKAGSVVAMATLAIGYALEKSAERQRIPASLALVTPSAEAGALLFKPEAKQRYTYDFQRKINIRGLGNEIPSIAYSGKFMIDVLSADAKGFSAVVHSKVQEYSGKEPPLLLVKMEAKGKVLEVKSAPLRDEELQQYSAVTKDLLSLWDFAADTDTLGKYEFRLEALPTKQNFHVHKKTKLKYLNQVHPTAIVSSTHWLRWDDLLAFPAEVKGDESTKLGQGQTSLDSITSYHLTFVGLSPIPAYDKNQLAKLTIKENLALSQEKGSDADYKKVDWAQLSEKLKRLDKMSSNERLATFGELTKLLRREPGSISKVLALLSPAELRAGADSTLFKTIVGALASSGSPEDQTALVGLYQNPDNPISGKGTILSAFTTTQAAPTAETTDFLKSESEGQKNPDLRAGASYALGSGLATGTGPSTEAALASLMSQWQAAKQSGDTNAQLSLLDAIGNSGRAEFFSDLKALAENQLALVALRAKAAFSVRFINTSDSRGLLVNTFANANETMRESAVAAVVLAPWAEEFRSPLLGCAGHEPVDRIQKECADILAAHAQVARN